MSTGGFLAGSARSDGAVEAMGTGAFLAGSARSDGATEAVGTGAVLAGSARSDGALEAMGTGGFLAGSACCSGGSALVRSGFEALAAASGKLGLMKALVCSSSESSLSESQNSEPQLSGIVSAGSR